MTDETREILLYAMATILAIGVFAFIYTYVDLPWVLP